MELKLLDFHSDLWETYHGACGSVRKWVERILTGMMESKEAKESENGKGEIDLREENLREELEDLCEALNHQMSFYPATYLAMPYLVKFLELKEHDFKWQVTILSNIGICLATDVPEQHTNYPYETIPEDILDSYLNSIELVKKKAKDFLFGYMEELKELDSEDLAMFYTGLLGILGDREAAFVVIAGAWSQCYPLCENCENLDEEIELDMNDEECMEEIVHKIEPADSVIGEWDGKSFTDTYVWLSNVLELLGAQEAVKKLSYFYGTYTCPECGAKGQVMELVKAALLEL